MSASTSPTLHPHQGEPDRRLTEVIAEVDFVCNERYWARLALTYFPTPPLFTEGQLGVIDVWPSHPRERIRIASSCGSALPNRKP